MAKLLAKTLSSSQIFWIEAITIKYYLPVLVTLTQYKQRIDASSKIMKPYHSQYHSFIIIFLGLSEMGCWWSGVFTLAFTQLGIDKWVALLQVHTTSKLGMEYQNFLLNGWKIWFMLRRFWPPFLGGKVIEKLRNNPRTN